MELAQDDSPVPPSVEQQWQSQYWCEGYIPNESVTVKSLLEVANTEHDRYLEGNEALQRAIQVKTDDIEQLKQELTEIKLQKPILEGKLMGPGNQLFDPEQEMGTNDVVEAVVAYGVFFSNWVRHTLNAFRAFIPV